MIKVEVVKATETAIIVRINKIPGQAKDGLRKGILRAIQTLSGAISKDYLRGQVLKRRTGTLARAVQHRMIADDVGIVGVGKEAWYGKLHEFGVNKTWEIKPKHAKALRFIVQGEVVYTKRVMHPGLKEKSFMRRGLRENRSRLVDIINKAITAEAKL